MSAEEWEKKCGTGHSAILLALKAASGECTWGDTLGAVPATLLRGAVGGADALAKAPLRARRLWIATLRAITLNALSRTRGSEPYEERRNIEAQAGERRTFGDDVPTSS